MNECIVQSINDNVGEHDVLWHLGDWSFGHESEIEKFRRQINCRNIKLVFGNHDQKLRRYYRHLFSETYDLIDTRIENQSITLCHYAMRVWNHSHHGSFHLYGHSHHTLPEIGKSMDVGWCKYRRPLEFSEISEILSKRDIVSVDRH